MAVYITSEGRFINGAAPLQVVHADVEGAATGCGKQPLKRLRFDLHPLKRLLLLTVAAIGAIPVAIVRQLPPPVARYTPVTDFVERAGGSQGACWS